jgi:hypothetical protein
MTQFQYELSRSEGVNGPGQIYAKPQIGVNQALYISEEILDYISSKVLARSFHFLCTSGTVSENWETKTEYLTMTAFIEKTKQI